MTAAGSALSLTQQTLGVRAVLKFHQMAYTRQWTGRRVFSTWQAVKSGVPRSLTLTLIHYASSEILLRKEKAKKIKSH